MRGGSVGVPPLIWNRAGVPAWLIVSGWGVPKFDQWMSEAKRRSEGHGSGGNQRRLRTGLGRADGGEAEADNEGWVAHRVAATIRRSHRLVFIWVRNSFETYTIGGFAFAHGYRQSQPSTRQRRRSPCG